MTRKNWELIREESAFVDWQRAKVQECADEVQTYPAPLCSKDNSAIFACTALNAPHDTRGGINGTFNFVSLLRMLAIPY